MQSHNRIDNNLSRHAFIFGWLSPFASGLLTFVLLRLSNWDPETPIPFYLHAAALPALVTALVGLRAFVPGARYRYWPTVGAAVFALVSAVIQFLAIEFMFAMAMLSSMD